MLNELDYKENFMIYLTKNGLSQINADMKPAKYGNLSLDENHIESLKKKFISVLPDKYKNLVKMGGNF